MVVLWVPEYKYKLSLQPMPDSILSRYGLKEKDCSVTPFGNGLINHTWKIIYGKQEWLLQRINRQIFKRPQDIMDNCRLLSLYLKESHPEYLFVAPLTAIDGNNYAVQKNNYYRLFPFIENSYSCDTVSAPALAYEASRQFGKFTRLLSLFKTDQLHITLPDFHNLSLRYQQFETAVENANKERLSESAESIAFLRNQQEIVEVFEKIKNNSSFKVRVIHHDSKINNVLFDKKTGKGLCVIDLDTVMPGYYFSDVGDMIRTYISPINEDDPNFGGIEVRETYFAEIVKGYLGEMELELSQDEKLFFVYAGKFAIYMQAIRFLADYLNNDIYYSIQYPEHNLVRANNQVDLLKKFTRKENTLNDILASFLG
jgi:hypothetical protein